MEKIPRFVVDSSEALTLLCQAGQVCGTDKSPYNVAGHRHPYTPVYSMLFAPLRNRPVDFAEIGVAMGSSAILWDTYFTHPEAKIHMFDRDDALLRHCVQRAQSPRIRASMMDVSGSGDIQRALLQSWASAHTVEETPEYDVILDDSSHEHGHQIQIIREAFPLLKRGGMLIIEDVFRSTPESDYLEPIKEILAQCSFAYFVDCEHKYKYSGDWNNDRILVLVKA